MENPNFLKQKYNLHNSEEVVAAALRTEQNTGEKVSQKPADRIQNYLDRLENIIHPPKLENHPDFDRRERNLNLLKNVLHEEFVIKLEEVPDGYFETQKRLAREQGHGNVEIFDEQKDQLAEILITDQKSSLDNWVDYLSSNDATYPDWLKYYAFRSILSLGEYDKETKQFTKRSKSTVKPFPDINREALAYVLDAIEKKYQPQTKEQKLLEEEKRDHTEADLTAEEKQERKADQEKFAKILQGENFAKLYAWAIDKVTPASKEKLANTEGKWIKYDRNSDHMPLVESLQGHGTGWCTAGESTAKTQLAGGDFYVYYSLDENGQAKIPRVAIRLSGNNIAEVRGVAQEQNLDPYISDVVKEKMKEFPDGAVYEKKAVGMKKLTEIDNKTKQQEPLTKDDLIFLYEINVSIEGFGFQRDPRIAEIIQTRNKKEDAPIALECQPNQIAYRQEDVNENTKAYIGPLFPGIFSKNLEHVYTSFPEGKIEQVKMTIGGKSKKDIIAESNYSEGKKIISPFAGGMLANPDFDVVKKPEKINLVRLKVEDLGFSSGATTKEIYEKVEELGLKLCPPEVGPQLRLNYEQIFQRQQPKGESLYVGMKRITDPNGDPSVFSVQRFNSDERWLYHHWAKPDYAWSAEREFVFRK
ncbi:MAG: hypothetical protein PHE24_02985 [Patescibacteria group bacterium]|nr:hypothetical protein [Patescibacteria group bacterium]